MSVGLVVNPLIAGFIRRDRKSTRLNSSHQIISYAVFCLKKKTIVHPKSSFNHEKHFVFVLMVMPGKRSLKLYQFEVLPVKLTNDHPITLILDLVMRLSYF